MRSKVFQNIFSSFSTASILQSLLIFSFIFTMSHFSSVEEYATYRRLFYIIDFTTVISLFGVNNLLLRKESKYYYEYISSVFLLVFVIQFVAVTIFSIVNKFSGKEFLIVSFFVTLNAAYQIMVSVLFRTGKRQLYAIEMLMSCVVVAIALIVLTNKGLLVFTNIYLLRILVLLIYLIPFLILSKKYLIRIQKPTFSKLRLLFKEVSPIGFGVLIGSCTLYIDKFFALMMDPHQLALYSNASADIPFVSVVITTMSACYIPIIHKLCVNKEYKQACNSLSDLFLFGWYIGVVVFTLLFINADLVVKLLYGEQYTESIPLFRVFCFTYILKIVSYTHLIISMDLEKIIIKRMLIEMILQFTLSFILFKTLGIIGLAISVPLVLALWSVPYNIYFFSTRIGCKIIEMFQWKKMLCFFVKTFLPCAICMYIGELFEINSFILLAITVLSVLIADYAEVRFVLVNLK